MAILKVPSVQHLARLWRDDPHDVKRALLKLAANGPTFNYKPLLDAVRDMLVFREPYDQIAEGFRRSVARQYVRDNYLEVLSLIRQYFGEVNASFVQDIEPRYYPVARDFLVPVHMPLVYGVDGEICLPWFSFWRANPLAGERLSLFVSVVDDIMRNDPDMEHARFVVLDFSAGRAGSPRALKVTDTAGIPRLSADRKAAMLAVFAEGFSLAQAELAQNAKRKTRAQQRQPDPGQRGFFDSEK